MSDTVIRPLGHGAERYVRDIGFAIGIVVILTILFLPIPPFLIDVGLAISISMSVLILMVALWIQKPLEFSSFPIILLIATMLRLSLNIATTRLILSQGHEGPDAAGNIINGFSKFVMSGDFVIGIIVFAILVVVNFLVITKGATRIAEVGARFTLDSIPGKQMAIDADLNAGLIDEPTAQLRRRELEEESGFFGAMDGASKFVRGDAVAGLIITLVNILGGIIIGSTRHDMPFGEAADVFAKLSVGDGLVTQIPALIVSLAAGLLVSKGSSRVSAEKAVLGQLGGYPRALFVAAALMFILSAIPGLPFIPFAILAIILSAVGYMVPRRLAERERQEAVRLEAENAERIEEVQEASVKESLITAEIELCMGRQLSAHLLSEHSELSGRVAKMRRKFAEEYGFVVPDIRLSDSLTLPAKDYEIRIHGTPIARHDLRPGELIIILGDDRQLDIPGDETTEPAFGMRAMWVSDSFTDEVRRAGLEPIENKTILLTHLSEVIRNNLPQLLSYKDMRTLIGGLDSEYQKLVDDICPAHISYSGIQAVLKLLLAERVSIRNLNLILEAIAEIAPHVRRSEQVVEHVRLRIAQQICGDLAQGGKLNILRLGSRWDLVFHESLKRDTKGDVVEFDITPQLIESFSQELAEIVREKIQQNIQFAVVTMPEARAYIRMIVERIFPTLPVLSHIEIARGMEVTVIGAVSE